MNEQMKAYEQKLRNQLAKLDGEIASKMGSRERVKNKLNNVEYHYAQEAKSSQKKVSKSDEASPVKETKTVLKKKDSEVPAPAAVADEEPKKKPWSLNPFTNV